MADPGHRSSSASESGAGRRAGSQSSTALAIVAWPLSSGRPVSPSVAFRADAVRVPLPAGDAAAAGSIGGLAESLYSSTPEWIANLRPRQNHSDRWFQQFRDDQSGACADPAGAMPSTPSAEDLTERVAPVPTPLTISTGRKIYPVHQDDSETDDVDNREEEEVVEEEEEEEEEDNEEGEDDESRKESWGRKGSRGDGGIAAAEGKEPQRETGSAAVTGDGAGGSSVSRELFAVGDRLLPLSSKDPVTTAHVAPEDVDGTRVDLRRSSVTKSPPLRCPELSPLSISEAVPPCSDDLWVPFLLGDPMGSRSICRLRVFAHAMKANQEDIFLLPPKFLRFSFEMLALSPRMGVAEADGVSLLCSSGGSSASSSPQKAASSPASAGGSSGRSLGFFQKFKLNRCIKKLRSLRTQWLQSIQQFREEIARLDTLEADVRRSAREDISAFNAWRTFEFSKTCRVLFDLKLAHIGIQRAMFRCFIRELERRLAVRLFSPIDGSLIDPRQQLELRQVPDEAEGVGGGKDAVSVVVAAADKVFARKTDSIVEPLVSIFAAFTAGLEQRLLDRQRTYGQSLRTFLLPRSQAEIRRERRHRIRHLVESAPLPDPLSADFLTDMCEGPMQWDFKNLVLDIRTEEGRILRRFMDKATLDPEFSLSLVDVFGCEFAALLQQKFRIPPGKCNVLRVMVHRLVFEMVHVLFFAPNDEDLGCIAASLEEAHKKSLSLHYLDPRALVGLLPPSSSSLLSKLSLAHMLPPSPTEMPVSEHQRKAASVILSCAMDLSLLDVALCPLDMELIVLAVANKIYKSKILRSDEGADAFLPIFIDAVTLADLWFPSSIIGFVDRANMADLSLETVTLAGSINSTDDDEASRRTQGSTLAAGAVELAGGDPSWTGLSTSSPAAFMVQDLTAVAAGVDASGSAGCGHVRGADESRQSVFMSVGQTSMAGIPRSRSEPASSSSASSRSPFSSSAASPFSTACLANAPTSFPPRAPESFSHQASEAAAPNSAVATSSAAEACSVPSSSSGMDGGQAGIRQYYWTVFRSAVAESRRRSEL